MISETMKQIARHETHFFEVSGSVRRAYSDRLDYFVDTIVFPDRPSAGTSVVATIGMAEFDNHLEANGRPLRVEVAATARSEDVQVFQQALSSAAFNVAFGDFQAQPDRIMPGLIRQYATDVPMEHLLLTDPVFGDRHLDSLDLAEMTIAWLTAIPLADSELEFARTTGVNQLKALLNNASVDVTDLRRAAVV